MPTEIDGDAKSIAEMLYMDLIKEGHSVKDLVTVESLKLSATNYIQEFGASCSPVQVLAAMEALKLVERRKKEYFINEHQLKYTQ